MNNIKKMICKSLVVCATFLAMTNSENTIKAEDNLGPRDVVQYSGNLKIASYNVFMLSRNLYPNWGQIQRADLISKTNFLKNNDVIIFNEAFDNVASTKLLENVKKEYPNQTPVLGRSKNGWDSTSGSYSSTVFEDGGVTIVSKHPIVKKEQYVYKNGCGEDYHSNKGFIYAKIEKNGQNVHVFGTHTQADDSSCSTGQAKNIRTSQFKELKEYIKSKNIPKNEVVLIGGDLNVNKSHDGKYTDEYTKMLKELNVNSPHYKGHTATWDPKTNSIAKFSHPNYEAEYLDYILVDKDHAQPNNWYNNALAVPSKPWSVTAHFKKYMYRDLSDHYPVIAGTDETLISNNNSLVIK